VIFEKGMKMQYPGSKRRIAKYISPIVLDGIDENTWYVEPFVGGCNMIDKIDHPKRIGMDTNEYLISMWKALQDGWIPPNTLSKEEYYDIKNNKEKYPQHLIGFVGVGCSFGAKWFGGYASNKANRNYCEKAKNFVMRQLPKIIDIKFYNCSYSDKNFSEPCILYCDPPYKNTIKYKDNFDHNIFWEWCRNMAEYGHKVYISEYNAPDDFVYIWKKDISSTLDIGQHDKRTEKLFIYKTT